jgi:hypothetical protein
MEESGRKSAAKDKSYEGSESGVFRRSPQPMVIPGANARGSKILSVCQVLTGQAYKDRSYVRVLKPLWRAV